MNDEAQDVDSLLKSTLDTLGVSVERPPYTGKESTFITYQLCLVREIGFADDSNTASEHLYSVDIFSKGDFIALLRRATGQLKAAGFYEITVNAEIYESGTGFYHVPIDIKYLEE